MSTNTLNLLPHGWVSKPCYDEWMANKPVCCVDGLLHHDGKFYLFQRKRDDCCKGLFWFFGGTVNKDETSEDAIKRKAREEIDIDVAISKRIGFYEVIMPSSKNYPKGYHAWAAVYLVEPVSPEFTTDSININAEYSDKRAFSTIAEIPDINNILYDYPKKVFSDSKVFK